MPSRKLSLLISSKYSQRSLRAISPGSLGISAWGEAKLSNCRRHTFSDPQSSIRPSQNISGEGRLGKEWIKRPRRRNVPETRPMQPDTTSSPSHSPIKQAWPPNDSLAVTYFGVQNGLSGLQAATRSISEAGGPSAEWNCRVTLLLVNGPLQTVGIDEEFASPVGILELRIFTRDREASFYSAAGLHRAIGTDSGSHVTVRRQPGIAETKIAGGAIQQQPAGGNLYRSRQTGPRHHASPLAVETAGQETIRTQRTQDAFRRLAGFLKNFFVAAEFIAGNQTAQHITDRVGERVQRIAQAAVGEPSAAVLVRKSPLQVPHGGFRITAA